MKVSNVLNTIGSLLVIAGAVMKILHLPHSNAVIIFGFVAGTLGTYLYIGDLKNKIIQLEKELASRK